MKRGLCCILVVCMVFGCILTSMAEPIIWRSYSDILRGISDDFDGNSYGWYAGDPNGTTVIITGLGNSQGAYDDNAIPSYTSNYWADKNVYWFAAEVNGKSGSIHDGFSKAELDVFAQAHYNNVKNAFPNADTFVIGGYSAGGWAIASLIDVVLQNGGSIAAVYGLDCVPRNAMYDAFVRAIGIVHALDIPIFIGASGAKVSGNTIEVRTVKFATQYYALIDFYTKYDCTHGTLCKDPRLIDELTTFVNNAIGDASIHEDSDNNMSESIEVSSTVDRVSASMFLSENRETEIDSIELRDVSTDENGNYVFLFNYLSEDRSIVKICSAVLTADQVCLLANTSEVTDDALTVCVEYYIDALSPSR